MQTLLPYLLSDTWKCDLPARHRHLSVHLREDAGDGAKISDAQADAPDQERDGEGGKTIISSLSSACEVQMANSGL